MAEAELLICVKCLKEEELPEDGIRPGEALYAGLQGNPPEGVKMTPTECLSNCKRGCSVALRGAGRWTFVYGNLHEVSDLDVIREGAAKYAATSDGLVPWRERPEHFRKNCIARIPPMETFS